MPHPIGVAHELKGNQVEINQIKCNFKVNFIPRTNFCCYSSLRKYAYCCHGTINNDVMMSSVMTQTMGRPFCVECHLTNGHVEGSPLKRKNRFSLGTSLIKKQSSLKREILCETKCLTYLRL